jgi:hypothetical protein
MLPPIDVPHLGDAQTCRIAHVIRRLLRDLRAKLSFAFKTSGSGAGPYFREERASISYLRMGNCVGIGMLVLTLNAVSVIVLEAIG